MTDKPAIGEPCNGCGLCCQVQVCATGSYALGLVSDWGERAPGPCPALAQKDDRWVCGVVERPKDWLGYNPRGVTVIREAFKLAIGTGAGCDEAGDEPDDTAGPKLADMQRRWLARHGREGLRKALETILHGRR